MVPVVSSVWSASPRTALPYPARYLFAFLDNHGMLSITGSPEWRTVIGGSRTYVERAVKELTAVATATRSGPCAAPRRGRDPRRRRPGERLRRVVVATHADNALAAAGRSDARRARRRWVRSATPETRPVCTPTTACCPPRPAPGHRGTTCSPSATSDADGGPGLLRHEPSAGSTTRAPTWSRSTPPIVSTPTRCWPA